MISATANDYEIIKELPYELLELPNNNLEKEMHLPELLLDALKEPSVNNQIKINNSSKKSRIN
jgi:hypothetical protein